MFYLKDQKLLNN